ncbi:glycosyltransferase family 2 protein [Alkalicaulis satelles]|uniref:Glycosyltransferase family 2 protein n=1 Tax=Alkalicaulis satelles TaxID=2609175 RepID=A0A5M6ZIP6_9PROT|nr:glycosyltransferase family 2 protein [Alkalicaulis satelles]KAA5804702.1 glycosyltransferase family 2 protein [Alkalicaulis satelles]
MKTAVMIPTFRRPDSLARALTSVFAQTRAPDEIIIADNDPAASARDMVEGLKSRAPCPLVYVHAPVPGVSNARNAGFAATDAKRIAQLDDDESAPSHWLAALIKAHEASGAGVSFGPVLARADGAGPVANAWLNRLYSRDPGHDEGLIAKPYGCGNSLIDRTRCALPDPPFDASANQTGGEDDILFAALKARGVRFGWAPEAGVTEHVESTRASLAHAAARSFAYGQGPSQTARLERRYGALAGWMAVGAAQTAVFSLALPFAWLAGPQKAAACLDRLVQGAGKVMCLDAVAPRFYGEAAAR